jgi:hypothetical protein
MASVVLRISNRCDNILFSNEGLNFEYTASNLRIVDEFQPQFTPMEKAIERVFNYYYNIKESISIEGIDARWK